MAKNAKRIRLKVEGELSDEALEMLALPEDALVNETKSEPLDATWTAQDIREAVMAEERQRFEQTVENIKERNAQHHQQEF